MLSAAVIVASAVKSLLADAPRPISPGTGVTIRFTSPAKGEMDLLGKCGLKYVRSMISWEEAESQPGNYNFAKYDDLVRELKAKGIRPIFCLTGANSAFQVGAPTLPEARASFARFVGEAANHFKGQDVVWELWNEPNTERSWKPSPSPTEYSILAVEAAKAMRFMDPNCRIIAPGVAGVDIQYLNSTLTEELLSLIDGVSVHPNRDGGPESIVSEVQLVRDLINRRAPLGRKSMPIICSSWGYSTARGKNSEGRQAMYISRMWLLNAALGVPVTVFDSWQDNGTNPDSPADRLGLVRENFDLKPSFIAAKEVQEKFQGCTKFRLLPQKDPLDWVIVGAGNGKLVQARWYQKEAGVKFSVLSLKEKRFKSLYASLMSEAETTPVKKVVAPIVNPPKTIARSMDGIDVAFAPPLDDDGWCVLVQKSTPGAAKLEFKYQRSSGANVTCYAKIEGNRAVEPLATSDESPTFSVGMNGVTSGTFRVQKTKVDADRWKVTGDERVKTELSTTQFGALVSHDGPGNIRVTPSSKMAIPEGAKSLVVWVRLDGSAKRLKSEFKDTSGQVSSADLGSMEGAADRNGWRVIKIPLGSNASEWTSLLVVEAERGGSIEIGPAAYMF